MKKPNMRVVVFYLCVLIAGCAKDENNCTPASQSFTFQTNKSIDTTAHEVSMVSGIGSVCKFQYNYEQCEGAVGAYVSREIYFEIPVATQSNFSIANESLTQANAYIYLKAPINPSLRTTRILQGSISGTQLSPSKWHITASVISGTETISFDEDFVRTE